MENKKNEHGAQNAPELTQDATGILPDCAPLAYPYVPFQRTGSQKYEPKFALVRGTLFPGLDLPFMGMVNTGEKSNTPLHELQALGFAVQELGLYLDTHPDDKEALELFIAYSDLYDNGAKEYQRRYGPFEQADAGRGGMYDWIDNPWPWDPHLALGSPERNGGVIMFIYNKKLQYPVKISNPNPRLASIIISQYGGPDANRLLQ